MGLTIPPAKTKRALHRSQQKRSFSPPDHTAPTYLLQPDPVTPTPRQIMPPRIQRNRHPRSPPRDLAARKEPVKTRIPTVIAIVAHQKIFAGRHHHRPKIAIRTGVVLRPPHRMTAPIHTLSDIARRVRCITRRSPALSYSNTTRAPRAGSARCINDTCVNGNRTSYDALSTTIRSPIRIVGCIDPVGTTFQSATALRNTSMQNMKTIKPRFLARNCFPRSIIVPRHKAVSAQAGRPAGEGEVPRQKKGAVIATAPFKVLPQINVEQLIEVRCALSSSFRRKPQSSAFETLDPSVRWGDEGGGLLTRRQLESLSRPSSSPAATRYPPRYPD